jgi:magnesium transporter
MRRARSINVSAPSSSLLHFLKSQSEEVCYFTPNHSLNLSRSPCSCLLRNTPYQSHLDRFPSATRRLGTSHRRRAPVEPPISSTEFPRIAPRQETLYQYPPATASRTGIFGTYVSQHSTITRRYASTDSRPLLKRLWSLKRQRPHSALKPNDLPPLPSFLDDAAGTTLGRSKGKAANELKLRCTEINEKGEVTLVNGEFKKSELIAKVRSESQVYTSEGTD